VLDDGPSLIGSYAPLLYLRIGVNPNIPARLSMLVVNPKAQNWPHILEFIQAKIADNVSGDGVYLGEIDYDRALDLAYDRAMEAQRQQNEEQSVIDGLEKRKEAKDPLHLLSSGGHRPLCAKRYPVSHLSPNSAHTDGHRGLGQAMGQRADGYGGSDSKAANHRACEYGEIGKRASRYEMPASLSPDRLRARTTGAPDEINTSPTPYCIFKYEVINPPMFPSITSSTLPISKPVR
jgi:hypothetical protein